MQITDTIKLKHGKMVISVEQTETGWQRVSRYTLETHPKFPGKVLTQKSDVFKSSGAAIREANKFAELQVTRG